MKTLQVQSDLRSRAAFFGHPLHPMIIPFPMAFLVATLVCDIAFKATGNLFWVNAAFWALIAGLTMGVLAAALGLIDFASIKAARKPVGWVHAGGNATALTLSAINLITRLDGTPPATGALILSTLVVAILAVTGWLGGELVFRHKIGTISS